MPEEIEAKIRVADPEAFWRRMAALGLTATGPVFEVNRLFDDARGSFQKSGSALRLREERPVAGASGVPATTHAGVPLAACPPVPTEQNTGGQAASGTRVTGTSNSRPAAGGAGRVRLTFKGPRRPGPLKRRPESEVEVAAAEPMAALLAALGLAEKFRYEKRRTTWRRGACEIVLDEVPYLGWFAEVEGPSEAAVLACLADLRLVDQPLVADSYVGLLAAALAARRADPSRAVF
jgi:adenylate cyclase class IV